MIPAIVCGVFAFLIAFVLTVRTIMGDDSETRELKARLRFYGIEPRRFSNQCLTELIEIGARRFRLMHAPTDALMREAMDEVSRAVVAITYGDKFCAAADLEAGCERGTPNPFWLVLAKHDPARFGLDRLDATQDANRRDQAERHGDGTP